MSLRVWLPLTSNIIENNGLENLDFSSSTAMQLEDNGKIGKCLYRNGAGIVRSNLFNVNSTTQASICIWLKMPADYTANGYIGGLTAGASPNFMFYNYGAGTIRIYINGSYRLSYAHGFAAEEWHHIAATYNGNLLTLYLDGKQVKTATGSWNIKEQERIMIGGRSNNADGVSTLGRNNYYNDFRYYDHCLSAAEVHDIAQGLVLHYKLNQANPNLIPTNTFDNAPWKGAIAAHEMYENRLAYRIANYSLYNNTNKGANDLFSGNITYAENTQYTLSVTWRDDYRTDNKTSALYLRFNYTDGSTATNMISPDNSLHEWKHQSITSTPGKTISKITTTYGNGGQLYITDLKLEIGTIDSGMLYTNNQIIDSSGYGHNAVIVGNCDIVSTSPRYSTAISMNNTSTTNHIESLENINFTNNITVSFWVKAALDKNQVIFTTKYIQFGILNQYGYINPASNGSAFVISSYFVSNEWNHICVVNNDGAFTLYVNGQVISRIGSADNYYLHNSYKLWLLNRSYNATYAADAAISDFRIYCTPLLDTDIKSLYNIGMRIDNFGGVHTYELVESDAKHIKKSGQLVTRGLEEIDENKARLTNSDGWQSSEFIEI